MVLHQLNDELHKALDTIVPLKEIQVAAPQETTLLLNLYSLRLSRLGTKWYEIREWIWHKYP